MIARYRRRARAPRRSTPSRGGTRQLALCLLGAVLQMGWEKALGDDDELAWWDERAADAIERSSAVTDIERELRRELRQRCRGVGDRAARVYRRLADALVDAGADRAHGCVSCSTSAPEPASRRRAAAEAGARVVACRRRRSGCSLHERDRPAPVGLRGRGAASRSATERSTRSSARASSTTFPISTPRSARLRASCVPGGASRRQHLLDAAASGEGGHRRGARASTAIVPPPWFATFKAEREPLSGIGRAVARCRPCASGSSTSRRTRSTSTSSGLDADGLAAYRLGMAHVQDHSSTALTPAARAALRRDAAAAAAPTLLDSDATSGPRRAACQDDAHDRSRSVTASRSRSTASRSSSNARSCRR